ncbi:MAG: exopolysaccharide Pel transporter PelG [Anaerotignum sp.]|nr:exopolysaccharide Pel transporter PelG [Anaerotignum sp.]
MAGIGFELKKLFEKKGLFAIARAYGYSGIVCTGPMLLGILLLLGIKLLSIYGGASVHHSELLNCMITYTLVASLLISNLLSMVSTRFLADALYEDKDNLVMPCYYGSISIMLVLGCVIYGIFLWYAGIPVLYQFLCLFLFAELVVVWTQINFLTAVKDYKGILLTFLFAIILVFMSGFLLLNIGCPTIFALLLSVTLGYGIMMVWYHMLLIDHFPQGKGSAFYFLRWVDRYPALTFLSEFLVLGLFVHIILMWYGPIGFQVQGLFYGAPTYDIPAEVAFLSILITTVNFVTSVEVNFYPKYYTYFSLHNQGGCITDIEQVELEMFQTLAKELSYTFIKQLLTTVFFIILGAVFIPKLPLYFSDDMMRNYQILCLGYAFYAIGNCVMLCSLYFSDNSGALLSGFFFALISIGGTIFFMNNEQRYYGVGFLLAGFVYTIISLLRLEYFLKRLKYYVLSRQPIVLRERRMLFTIVSEALERRYDRKYGTIKETNS